MKVIGIDLDPLKIARANEIMKQNPEFDRCSFQVMDATNLSSFTDNQFRGAYICWDLEHLTADKALTLLKEVRRVVAPGGLILINEAIMGPDDSVSVASLKGCPPFTKDMCLSLVKMQSKIGGNANFGEENNMCGSFKKAGWDNYVYEKKTISQFT